MGGIGYPNAVGMLSVNEYATIMNYINPLPKDIIDGQNGSMHGEKDGGAN